MITLNAVRNARDLEDGRTTVEFWTIPLDGRAPYKGADVEFANDEQWDRAIQNCYSKGWLLFPSDREIAGAISAAGGIVTRCRCQEIAVDPYDCPIHGAKMRAARDDDPIHGAYDELRRRGMLAGVAVSAYHEDAEGRWCGGAEA